MAVPLRAALLGFGSEVLGDDALGLRVATEVAARLTIPVFTFPVFGLEVTACLEGYDAAFAVDVMEATDTAVGAIRRFALDEFRNCRHLCSPHCTDLAGGIAFARTAGMAMPARIAVYAVVIRPVSDFRDTLSPELARRFPALTETLTADIRGLLAAWQRGEDPAITAPVAG